MAQEKYDVFISYSRKDYVDENKNVIPGNVVSIIKDRLTAEGISYWFDEEGIYSGQNFVEKIVTNIEASRVFVFLSTENANASPWTCKEIASADEFKKLIIPVRIDRTPYNRKVLFRIADLNYLEYYVNPEKALNDPSYDKTLRIWYVSGQTGIPIGLPLTGHLNKVLYAVFSPDGKRIVSASYDNTVRIWNVSSLYE